MLDAERELGVDLVADEPEVVTEAELADRDELLARHHGAGRVVRRRQQHARASAA